MTLKDYLELPGHNATKLAQAVGCSVSTITRAADGDTLPSRKTMQAISDATRGAVMPNDFFGQAA